MSRIKNIILLLLFLSTMINSTGQLLGENNFTRYTTHDGLSDNNVTGITQDAAGYIWMATSSGLNRYDGSRFIQYHSTNDSLSPAAEGFSRISRLGKDRIAFLPTGLHIINTKTGERRNVFVPYHDKQYQYKFNMVERASSDAGDNSYVLTRSGFYHFDKNYRLLFRFDYFAEKDVPSRHFFFGNDLIELDDKRLLIAARPGLYIYHKEKREFSKLSPGDYPLLDEFLRNNTYFKFFQVKPGKLLVTKADTDSIFYIDVSRNKKYVSRSPFVFNTGIIQWRSKLIPASDTLFYLTGQTSGFYSLTLDPASGSINLMPEKYFTDHLCNDMLADRDDHLWVATNNGVFRQDNARRVVQTVSIPVELNVKYPGFSLTALYVTANKIYAGARAGGGLLVFDKKTLQFERNWLNPPEPKTNTILKVISPSSFHTLTGSVGTVILYNETTGAITSMNAPSWSNLVTGPVIYLKTAVAISGSVPEIFTATGL